LLGNTNELAAKVRQPNLPCFKPDVRRAIAVILCCFQFPPPANGD
jgi:hypothetical protein